MFYEVIGVPELDKALVQLEKRVQNQLIRRATREVARHLWRVVIARVPVDTGLLARSLRVRTLGRVRGGRYKGMRGHQVQTSKGFYKGEDYYGSFIEFGTAKMVARPFLRPSADAVRPDANRRFITAVGRAIAESRDKTPEARFRRAREVKQILKARKTGRALTEKDFADIAL